MLESMQMRED